MSLSRKLGWRRVVERNCVHKPCFCWRDKPGEFIDFICFEIRFDDTQQHAIKNGKCSPCRDNTWKIFEKLETGMSRTLIQLYFVEEVIGTKTFLSGQKTRKNYICFLVRKLSTGVSKNLAHRRKMLNINSHGIKIFILMNWISWPFCFVEII